MRRLAISIGFAAAVLFVVAAAQGELVQKGNLRIAFEGQLLPHALPRERRAPVSVHINGSISAVDGTRPPQLREISIAVNRAGRLFFAGLPVCPGKDLEQTSTKAALEICGSSLVGHGRFAANVDFTNSSLIPAHGRVLAFNSRFKGRPAILLHIFGSTPVRVTFILPFEISHRSHGDFGTVFKTRIPQIASNLGYVTDLDLTIGRKYHYAGKQRSFFSASCAAPAGFSGAVFPLARATFSFVNGQQLTTGLVRNCRVR